MGTSRSRSWAVLLLLTGVLVGCGEPSAEDGGQAPPVAPGPSWETGPPEEPEPSWEPDPTEEPDPPPLASPAGASPDSGCPSTHPLPFTLTPIAPEFADVVADLRACTDLGQRELYVENHSMAVWELLNPQLPPFTGMTGDVKVDTFRAVMANRPPTHRLLEPKRAMSFSMADGFFLLPHDAATALWHTQLAVESLAQNHALGSAGDVLAGGAPGRKVAADCGLAAFDAVKALRSLDELERKRQQAPSLFVLDMMGLTSGTGECASSARHWQQTRRPTAPAFTDELSRELAETYQAGSFDKVVRMVMRANPRG